MSPDEANAIQSKRKVSGNAAYVSVSLSKMQIKDLSLFMSGIDAVLYEYVKFIHVIYGSFSVFRLQPLYAFLSTYAYS